MNKKVDFYTALFKDLADPQKVSRSYLFFGPERYLMDRAVETLSQTLKAEKVFVDASGKNFADELSANLQGGLFEKKKLIVIKYVSSEGKVSKFFPVLFRSGVPFVIVSESDIFKNLPKEIVKVFFPRLDSESFKVWLKDKIVKMKKTIPSNQVFEKLSLQMPLDLNSALNELKKLELYTFGSSILKEDDFRVISEYEKSSSGEVLLSILGGERMFFKKLQNVLAEIPVPTYFTAVVIDMVLQNLQEAQISTREKTRGNTLSVLKERFSKSDLLRLLLESAKYDGMLKSISVDKSILLWEMALKLKLNASTY